MEDGLMNYTLYGLLEQFEKDLAENNFVKIHQSYLAKFLYSAIKDIALQNIFRIIFCYIMSFYVRCVVLACVLFDIEKKRAGDIQQ